MVRALPYLLILGAAVAGLLWLVQRGTGGRQLAPGTDIAAAAVLAYGPDRGPGRLHVTPSQLIFTGDSGRVMAIERIDVTGVGLTRDLPDRSTAAPVLVVSTGGEVLYFQVEKAEEWVRLLT